MSASICDIRLAIVDEILTRILDLLQPSGPDFWIVLGCAVLASIFWFLLGTTKRAELKVRWRQVAGVAAVAIVAGFALAAHHLFFKKEPVFSKNVTGILILHIVGDDAANSRRNHNAASLGVRPRSPQFAVAGKSSRLA